MPNQPKKAKLPDNHQEHSQRYGHTHRKLRKELLRQFPLCQICNLQFSEHAHHLIPIATELRHYQALCKKCHYKLEHKE